MERQTDSSHVGRNEDNTETVSPEKIYQPCPSAPLLIGVRGSRSPQPLQFVLFRIVRVLASLILLGGGLAACGSSGSGNAPLPPGQILTAITIDPSNSSIADGTTVQLHATGVFSDGTAEDLTQLVTWASADATIAEVSNSSGSKGLAAGAAIGSTTITAAESGITGSCASQKPHPG